MVFLIFAILIVAAAVGGYLYGREGRKPVDVVADRARDWGGTVQGWGQSAWSRLSFDRPKVRAEHFRAWLAAQPEADGDLVAWAGGLEQKEAEAFARRAAAFASDRDLELAWLWDDRLADDPDLKAELEAAVLDFCRAYGEASQARENVAVFTSFLAWQKAPNRRRNRQISQQLFGTLVDQGTITVPIGFYAASKRKQRAFMNKVLAQFAEENRTTFNAMLKVILFPKEGTGEGSVPVEERLSDLMTGLRKAKKRTAVAASGGKAG